MGYWARDSYRGKQVEAEVAGYIILHIHTSYTYTYIYRQGII